MDHDHINACLEPKINPRGRTLGAAFVCTHRYTLSDVCVLAFGTRELPSAWRLLENNHNRVQVDFSSNPNEFKPDYRQSCEIQF
jgi:hypothetical protein